MVAEPLNVSREASRTVRRELKRSPHRIWLAGLGALARAAGDQAYQDLVATGEAVQKQWGEDGGAVLMLAQVRELFDLSFTELGELFGTSRQAVSAWLEQGVPTARQPKLHTLWEIGELLDRKLQPGRIPAVFRKPAAAYEGASMFDWVSGDRHDAVLDRLRSTFDWAATA